jgi:peptide/nickel transport system substrate-binding protein
MFLSDWNRKFYKGQSSEAEINAAISKAGAQDWVGLINWSVNATLHGEMPKVTPWYPAEVTDTLARWTRNHYFWYIDPEGNQLPYTDEATIYKMENRDTAVFRSMNGEQDGNSGIMQLPDLPLLLSNMEKGDYSIYQWPSPGGADLAIPFTQDWNTDPELGRLLRTKDFRLALSHAIDRNSVNEGVFLGIGTIQNWVPHPSTPYYAAEARDVNIAYDVAKANQLLDGMGLKKDSQGRRLRSDNNQPIVIDMPIGEGPSVAIMDLTKPMWAAIGITVNYRVGTANLASGDDYTSVRLDYSAYQAQPWSVDWTRLAPLNEGADTAPKIGTYIKTAGKEGMAKGTDSTYLPPAPATNYPADVSGNLEKTVKLWQDGRAFPSLDPRRIEMGKELFRVNANEMYALQSIAFSAVVRGIFVNRNNMLGQPKTHTRDHNGFIPWVYYFEGGMDNEHNPGNVSKTRDSYSFLTGN